MDAESREKRLRAVIATQTEIAQAPPVAEVVMDLVVRRAEGLTGADGGVLELPEGDEMVYAVASGAAAPYLGVRLSRHTSLSGLSLKLNETLYCADSSADPRVDGEASRRVGAGSMICVPLRHGGEVVGVLKVYAATAHAFDQSSVEVLELLAGMVAAHISNAARFEALTHESRHDVLTGLANRRAYDERLATEAARARRFRQPLSLALLDLDGFKTVNDELGHPAGDAALVEVAAVLAGSRTSDDAFRIGGDEFALLMPKTDREQARVAARRIMQKIESAQICEGRISASVGVGCTAGDPVAIHAEADAALLAAKHRLYAAPDIARR
jgi:diguanylate cyclase (GGDEF)-like protein